MPLNLNRFLLKDGTDLNFFQAVHLLERLFKDKGKVGTGDDMRSEPIRFETLNSLAFPAAEVAGVLPPMSFRLQAELLDSAKRGDEPPEDLDALPPIGEMLKSGNGPLRMSVTFMGLYGVSSPLPSYFTDPITLKKIEYFELKKFLDIFTHRLYSHFYRSWKKYRHFAQFQPQRPDDYTLRLLALTGQWPRRNKKVAHPGRIGRVQPPPHPLCAFPGEPGAVRQGTATAVARVFRLRKGEDPAIRIGLGGDSRQGDAGRAASPLGPNPAAWG